MRILLTSNLLPPVTVELAAQDAVQALLRDVGGTSAQRVSRSAFASWLHSRARGSDAPWLESGGAAARGDASAAEAAAAYAKGADALSTVGARMQRMVRHHAERAETAGEPWRVRNISGRALPILVGAPPGVSVGSFIADAATRLVSSEEHFHAADGTQFVLLYLSTGSDDVRLWTISEVIAREGAETTKLFEKWTPWSAHVDREQGRWCVA